MNRVVSPEALANAKLLFATHLRRPDGSCRCGKPYTSTCRQDRSYAFNTLKLAGVDLTEATA